MHQLTRLNTLYESILEKLEQRVYDVHVHTRSATLKILSDLIEQECVYKVKFGKIAHLAVDRLKDKAVYVRKAALSLLTMMLDHNSFGSSLNKSHFESETSAIKQKIKLRLNEVITLAYPPATCEGVELPVNDVESCSTEPEAEAAINTLTDDISELLMDDASASVSGTEPPEISETEMETLMLQDPIIQKLQVALDESQNVISFLSALDLSGPRIKAMLRSKTNTDVVEALKFYMRAVNFGVQNSLRFLLR
jgi:condensin complex subunit 1